MRGAYCALRNTCKSQLIQGYEDLLQKLREDSNNCGFMDIVVHIIEGMAGKEVMDAAENHVWH